MRLKVKIKTKVSPDISSEKIKKYRLMFKELLKNQNNKNYVINLYNNIFETIPNDSVYYLAKNKLLYYIYKRTMTKEEWDKKSELTKNRYQCAKEMRIDKLDESSKFFLLVEKTTNNIEEGIEMKDKTKTKKVGGGLPKNVGKKLGLSIWGTWCHLFKEGTKTDKEISTFMHAEFPDKKSKVFDNVTFARKCYNTGKLTKGVLPKPLAKEIEDPKAAKKASKTEAKPEAKKVKIKIK